MNKNILVLRNNVTDLTTLNSGLSLAQTWCKTIGLNLTFTQVDTDTQFNSIPFSNQDAKGYTVDPVQVFQTGQSIDKNQDIYLLIYDWTKITPQPTNPSDGGRGMSIPMQWYAQTPSTLSQFLLHELCHYFFGDQSVKPDITHLLVNGALQAQYPALYATYKQLQPQDWYLYLLKQFIPTQPTVTITRTSDDGKETIGELRTSDGQFGCYTLEKPWLNNQLNISCVPKGTYQCVWAYQGDLKEYHYELQNTSPRSGIFIHEGSFNSNTEGCILLGGLLQDINNDGELDLLNSRSILSYFEAKFNKQSFQLVIC